MFHHDFILFEVLSLHVLETLSRELPQNRGGISCEVYLETRETWAGNLS